MQVCEKIFLRIFLYSHRRLFEMPGWSLRCFLTISSETMADSVTAPAMAPSTMPTKAPLLIPDDEAVGNSVPETMTQYAN